MRLHGLVGWKIEVVDEGKKHYAYCYSRKKKIQLSEHFLTYCDASQLVDVVLHEIAHALLPPKEMHGELWKQKCVEIGAKPSRLVEFNTPDRYQTFCPNCGRFITRSKKPSTV